MSIMIHIKVCEFFQLLTLLTRGMVGPEASCAFQGSPLGPKVWPLDHCKCVRPDWEPSLQVEPTRGPSPREAPAHEAHVSAGAKKLLAGARWINLKTHKPTRSPSPREAPAHEANVSAGTKKLLAGSI